MPHHVDFSKFENVHELNIEVIGWQNPTTIEYTFQSNSFETALFWRVKGTTHTFVITLSEFNSLAGGEIELHFQQALTVFRDDMIEWAASGLKEKWMREYIYMFKQYIII